MGQSVGADDRVIFFWVTESALATDQAHADFAMDAAATAVEHVRAEEKARAAALRERRVQNALRGDSVWVQVENSSLLALEDMPRVLIWGNFKLVVSEVAWECLIGTIVWVK